MAVDDKRLTALQVMQDAPVIPVIVLYALFSERVVRGMTAGAIK